MLLFRQWIRFFCGIRMVCCNRNFSSDQFPDIFQIWSFFNVAKRYCNSAGSCSSCSSDTMNIGFRNIGKIIVYNMTEFFYVDSTGGDVCCNKNPDVSFFKIIKCPLSYILCFLFQCICRKQKNFLRSEQPVRESEYR